VNRYISVALLVLLLSLGSCQKGTPEQQAARFLNKGKALIEKRDYARAVLELKNAGRLDRKNPELFYQLGLAYLALGDYPKAIESLFYTTKLNPKHAGAQLKLAELMAGSSNVAPGVLQDAERRAAEILAVSPDNLDALTVLAITELRLGKPVTAAEHLEEVLDKFPGRLEAAQKLAILKASHLDYAGADQVLKRAVDRSPRSVELHIALARLYMLAPNLGDPEVALRQALAIEPKNGPALLDLASLQVRQGKRDQADQTYRQLSALPQVEYRPLHAIFLFDQGRREDAIKELQQLAGPNLKDSRITMLLIRAYMLAQQYPEAERTINAVLKNDSKNIGARLERARLYLATARAREAESDLMEVLQREPTIALAHYLMAVADMAQGRELKQREEFSKAVDLEPGFLAARMQLAKLFIAEKFPKGAVDLLDHAPSRQQRSLELITQRNWALLALKDWVRLRKGIDQGLAIRKTEDLLVQDGLLRANNRDIAGARTSMSAVLEMNPEDTRALDAIAKISFQQNEPGEAVATIRDYVSRRPQSAALQMLLADWLVQLRQLPEARKALDSALDANPNLIAAKIRLASLDITEGKLDSARKLLTSVASTPDGRIEGELRLGMLETLPGGNLAASVAHYRKVLDAAPNNLIALNDLAYYLARSPQTADEARELAQRARALDPDSPVIADTLGWAFYNKGLYPNAIEYLQEAVGKAPTAERKYHLAMAYLKNGDARGERLIREARKMDDPTIGGGDVRRQADPTVR
jgi:tetratricopeptide (TPR) repeat protein